MEKDQERIEAQPNTNLTSFTSCKSSNVSQGDTAPVVETVASKEGLYGIQLWICLLSLISAVLLISLNASMLATAIPRITNHFHSLDDVGWYTSIYILSYYLTCLAIFTIGSIVSAAATSSAMFIIGRTIAGIGGSGIATGALSIITACAPLEKRPTLMGFLMSFFAVGNLTGPLIGGALTEHTSWRWCFYINVPPAGLTAALLMLIRIPDQRDEKVTRKSLTARLPDLDIVGFLIWVPMCTMFFLAIQWGGVKYSWDSTMVIGLFCGAAGTLPIFVFWERRKGDDALIPPSLFNHRITVFACLTGFAQMGGLLAMSFYLPIWFQAVKDASPLASGLMTLPQVIADVVAAVVSGVAVTRFGYYLPWALFGNAVASIGTGLTTSFIPDSSAGNWIGYQILIGVGRGTTMQMPLTAMQCVLPAHQLHLGNAIVMFSQFFGSSVIVAVSGTIFTNKLPSAIMKYAPSVDLAQVEEVGAIDLRRVWHGEVLYGIRLAYNSAVINGFYVSVAASCLAFLLSWGLGTKSVKEVKAKREEVPNESEAKEQGNESHRMRI
ncbi:MFS general substrate transporter [Patellaria atrata CBS 101060]|uniref:MFS general substrate transporter n=1 Tax=Patellaria atrata CBS 101060 TaxID=1346257 RepID=A0A9P4SHD8_9PEZI|nr:MFS general substrate transporter [Patellaria atrata CBS 101060]